MDKALNILVVDDDQDDHYLLQEAISANKNVEHNIIAVHNGIEAMDYLLKKGTYENAQILIPDFIVLDLNMPFKDGFTTLQEIKNSENLKNIPVYILSTTWTDHHKETCRKMGSAGFFTKPSSFTDLTISVQKMISDLQ